MQFDILIINDYAYINGGASKIAINTAIALSERSHDVTFFAATPPIDLNLKFSRIKTILTYQKDIGSYVNKIKAGIQGLWNRKAEEILSILLNEFDPSRTILHFHSWTKALSPSIFKPVIDRGFKITITVHDYFLLCPNGGLFNFRKGNACNDIPMSLNCLRKNCDARAFSHKIWRVLRHKVQTSLLKSLWNNVYLIAPSNFAGFLISKYLTDFGNLKVISNPIDIKKFKPVEVQKNEAFVYVGRLSKEKGILLFAEAAKKLNIKAIFIGDGYLKDEILKIYPKAKVTGWLSENELNELLRTARVIVYPSLCYETQGLAVLEAKAIGIPAIVSDCCAAREYINDGIDGLIFKGGDLTDLTEKINFCHSDFVIEKMSERAYENYWKNPSTIDKYVESLEMFYNSIISR